MNKLNKTNFGVLGTPTFSYIHESYYYFFFFVMFIVVVVLHCTMIDQTITFNLFNIIILKQNAYNKSLY